MEDELEELREEIARKERKIRRLEEIEPEEKPEGKKSKLPKFKLPWGVRGKEKMSMKKPDHVFVQYLSQKGDIEFRVERIVSGNIVVIRNKAHVISPRRSYRYGKNMWYIIKEIDRLPVSNLDSEKLKRFGRSTEDDVPLIKAAIGAIQKQQTSLPGGKTIWIILGVVAVVGIIIYFIFGKG